MKLYSIPLNARNKGVYEYSFVIDRSFFGKFEESQIKEGSIKVDVKLDNRYRLYKLELKFAGSINLNCFRCSNNFPLMLNFQKLLLVQPVTEFEEETSDEIIQISLDAGELDLKNHFYELIHLAIPLKPECDDFETSQKYCNKETLEYLKKIQQKTITKETDPRWDALKKIGK